MTSIYLKCDEPGCGAVVDRRPKPDDTHGGTYHWSEPRDLEAYARSIGWNIEHTPVPFHHHGEGVTKHWCPIHKDRKP